ncbi:MAG: maleylpyruvate isomerase family mycothiol-dependent enzyme [Pseudonocardiaceae bacterium]|nr:maleylpyruvate isomerase family mycothiol-dependent enzyme [Pseudonocardiaceae bacterium]
MAETVTGGRQMIDTERKALLYRATRERTSRLVPELTEAQLATVSPACPKWTVQDILAHLVGGAADIVSDNLDISIPDEWTGKQVRDRRGRSVAKLIDEWDEVGPQVERIINDGAHRSWIVRNLYLDSGQHEADIRAAAGLPRPPDELLWRTSLEALSTAITRAMNEHGTVTVRAGAGEYEWGAGNVIASLEVEPYELCRGLFGRRSRRQMLEWEWRGNPEPIVDLLPRFPARSTDLVD